MARVLMSKTQTWHEFNADGSTRDPHCCGCWNIFFDDELGWPLGVCNECGEEREMLMEPPRALASAPGAAGEETR